MEHQAEVLQARLDEAAASSVELLQIFRRVRAFLVKRRCVCYGGTAINNLLPVSEQFYGDTDVPDYDAYSDTPIQDAKDMVDELRAAGIGSVEAKAGVHVGTFKVFANYVAVLDLTELPRDLFECLQASAMPDARDGLLYAHPMYLRVGVHVELSRPMGDVSRWSKVAQRLAKLDKAFPLTDERESARLDTVLRAAQLRYPLPLPPVYDDNKEKAPASAAAHHRNNHYSHHNKTSPPSFYNAVDASAVTCAVISAMIALGGAFAGELANRVYRAIDNGKKSGGGGEVPYEPRHTPFADVLVPDMVVAAGKVAGALGAAAGPAERAVRTRMEQQMKRQMMPDAPPEGGGEDRHNNNRAAAAAPQMETAMEVAAVDGVRLLLFPPVLDIVPWRLEVMTNDGRRLVAVHETNACYAYSETSATRALASAFGSKSRQYCGGGSSKKGGGGATGGKMLRLANLDTAVTLLCIIAFVPRCHRPDALNLARALLTVFARHRADQHRPWARFQLPCLGQQHGLVEMRQEKVDALDMFKQLGVRAGEAYDRWFLKYAPGEEGGGSSGRGGPGGKKKKSKHYESFAATTTRRTARRTKSRHHRRPTTTKSRRRATGGLQSFLAKVF